MHYLPCRETVTVGVLAYGMGLTNALRKVGVSVLSSFHWGKDVPVGLHGRHPTLPRRQAVAGASQSTSRGKIGHVPVRRTFF